jgi:hypothetical protein
MRSVNMILVHESRLLVVVVVVVVVEEEEEGGGGGGGGASFKRSKLRWSVRWWPTRPSGLMEGRGWCC